MKALSIALLIVILTSCSKNIGLKEPTCHLYCLLSDKYNVTLADTIYDHTDTLWGKAGQYAYACGSDIDSMKVNLVTWYHDCIGFPIQCERYVFDGLISYPKLFK